LENTFSKNLDQFYKKLKAKLGQGLTQKLFGGANNKNFRQIFPEREEQKRLLKLKFQKSKLK
jgi:hypothetical protein